MVFVVPAIAQNSVIKMMCLISQLLEHSLCWFAFQFVVIEFRYGEFRRHSAAAKQSDGCPCITGHAIYVALYRRGAVGDAEAVSRAAKLNQGLANSSYLEVYALMLKTVDVSICEVDNDAHRKRLRLSISRDVCNRAFAC